MLYQVSGGVEAANLEVDLAKQLIVGQPLKRTQVKSVNLVVETFAAATASMADHCRNQGDRAVLDGLPSPEVFISSRLISTGIHYSRAALTKKRRQAPILCSRARRTVKVHRARPLLW